MNIKKIITFILIVVIIIFCLSIFKNEMLKMIYPKKYMDIVSNYTKEYNVDECLIYAVIKAESNFKENAVSNKDAVGLMQIMEDTALDVAKEYNIEIDENNARKDIQMPINNINIGTKYLSTLLEKYGNVEVAVAAYNAGTGTVDKWIETGIIKADGSDIENVPYKETNNYIRKILSSYKMYKQLY